MKIIPVIDLFNGIVVHAKKGDRKNYQAIHSLISNSSMPLDIVGALLEYYPFQQLYIADLNAIQKIGTNNSAIIESIAQHYPKLELWIDAGIGSTQELILWTGCNFNLILGSENFSDLENFLAIKKQLGSNFILSLDYLPEGYKGPAELIESTEHWPEKVILMSLAHVGANQGTNAEVLERFLPIVHHFKLYAAGGVRNADDLAALEQAGYYGVLLASALHGKQITSQEIEVFSQ